MAVSSVAGDIGGGIQITCILNEGAPTVNTSAINDGGKTAKIVTFATPLEKGDPVSLYAGSEATYAATGGLPVVDRVAGSDSLVIGTIVSAPILKAFPANTAAGDTFTKQLTGKYYRVATVELWGGITSIRKATITTQDQSAVAPGTTANLMVKVDASVAAHGLCLIDVTTGGVGIMALTYVAKAAAATTSILVGITGPGVAS